MKNRTLNMVIKASGRKTKATAASVNCPFCKTGILIDTSPRLATALGVKKVTCDICGQEMTFKVAA